MNEEHFPHELDRLYKRIYGGISWPGTRPGFICIIGELTTPETHRFNLLDEAETFDTEQLIRRAGAFDTFYMLEKFLTGSQDKAVTKLLIEYNKSLTSGKPGRRLRILPSRIKGLEDDLFRYYLPKLKSMIGPEGELDISGGKLLLNYLSVIQDADIAAIKAGDYPSVEAAIYCMSDLDIDRKTKQQTKVNNEYERI